MSKKRRKLTPLPPGEYTMTLQKVTVTEDLESGNLELQQTFRLENGQEMKLKTKEGKIGKEDPDPFTGLGRRRCEDGDCTKWCGQC